MQQIALELAERKRQARKQKVQQTIPKQIAYHGDVSTRRLLLLQKKTPCCKSYCDTVDEGLKYPR